MDLYYFNWINSYFFDAWQTDLAELDGIMVTVNDNLAPAQKEDLMLMVLSVISADNQKDAAEMNLLAALIEGLKIPDKVMN